MKDVTGVLQTQALRLLIVYILPGGLVVIPYYRILPFLYPKVLILVPSNDVLRGIGLFCAATLVGMILEDLGTRLERRWNNVNENVAKYWYKYLSLKFDHEPVGIRQATDLQMRLKFELSACCATVLAAIPVVPFLGARTSIWFAAVTAVAALILAWYLWFEARSSYEVLHKIRMHLCDAYAQEVAVAPTRNPASTTAKPVVTPSKRLAKKRSTRR